MIQKIVVLFVSLCLWFDVSIASPMYITALVASNSYKVSIKKASQIYIPKKPPVKPIIIDESYYTAIELHYYNMIPAEYRLHVKELNKSLDIPYTVIYNLVYSESRWYYHAIHYNKDGSIDKGIMQLNSWYVDLFVKDYYHGKEPFDVYNPYDSLQVGLSYLKELYTATGDWYLAICAYKAGLRHVERDTVPDWVQKISEQITYQLGATG